MFFLTVQNMFAHWDTKKFFHTTKVDPLLMSNAAYIILKWLGPFARQRNWNVVKEQIFIFNFSNFLFLIFLFIFLNSKLLILRPNLLLEGLGTEARILQMFKPTLKRNWSFYENFSYIQTTKLNGSKRIKKLADRWSKIEVESFTFSHWL